MIWWFKKSLQKCCSSFNTLKNIRKNIKEHDTVLRKKLNDISEVHQSLKDAVKGTKEQTAAIVDKFLI